MEIITEFSERGKKAIRKIIQEEKFLLKCIEKVKEKREAEEVIKKLDVIKKRGNFP